MKPFLFLAAFFLPIFSFADVRLPAVISNHMVLQQKAEVRIWGWCEPGEQVRVKASWDTATYTSNGSERATWSVLIKTPSAGGPHTITITGYNKIVLEDVMLGEVWVCSGQSNMEMNMNWGLPYAAEARAAANNNIRFFHVAKTASGFPQDDLKAWWTVSSEEEMKKFSAVAYFFGQRLQSELKVPIGLIHASWSGSPAEVWTPGEKVQSDSALKKAAAALNPSKWWPVAPGSAFNAMLHPLTNFSIAGAIYYQGESNVGADATYTGLMKALIGGWREKWKKDLPFYFVQIAPYSGYGDNSSGAFLREAQTKVLDLPNTGMVLTSDLVDSLHDIHPRLKKEAGLRLANYALAQTYGEQGMVYKSPLYQSMMVEKDKIRIRFTNAEDGLVSRNGPPNEFYIAGADQKFIPAQARIEGGTIMVWSKKLKDPVAVRFGFRNAALPNLFSKSGLPVGIFRTDNWPVHIVVGER